MKRKKVIVLARHKLIYVDTILPVLHELNNNNNNIFTKIIVDDYALGYKKIKENIVINDILSSIGEIILIQGRSDYRTIRWIHALLVLFGIAWDGLRGGILIHFGSANTYPFKLLRLFFQQEKIYLSEAGIVNKVWKKIENRFLDRPQEAHVENKYLDKVICYSEWFYDHSNSRGEESFFYGPSRVTSAWIKYINDCQEKYLKKYHPDINHTDIVVTFFPTNLGQLPILNNTSTEFDLFVDVLDVFEKHFTDVVLMIKPHAVTNINLLVSEMNKRNIKHRITYLHPTILILRSSIVIASTPTNIFGDSKLIGTPTIEYSDLHKDILECTNGGSMAREYVDSFINKDKSKLISDVDMYIKQKIIIHTCDYPGASVLINNMLKL